MKLSDKNPLLFQDVIIRVEDGVSPRNKNNLLKSLIILLN